MSISSPVSHITRILTLSPETRVLSRVHRTFNDNKDQVWLAQSRNLNNIFVEKPEGKRPRGRYRCRFEDNIKINLKEGREDVNWTNVAEDRVQWRDVVRTVIDLDFHQGWIISWLAGRR
jgi:hypothetical protein